MLRILPRLVMVLVSVAPSVAALDAGASDDSLGREARELVNRGVVALPVDHGVFVSWRLLKDDPNGIAFDVYRTADGQRPRKINVTPITQTTDYLDKEAPPGASLSYTVRPAKAVKALSGTAVTAAKVKGTPYLSIPLKDKSTTFQKVGIADLNGDGDYDFVIKRPNSNIDPWHKYWKRSPGTYKLEAYQSDGTFLWEKDLGWAIEQGIWYSPWIACDLTGDGKAEVAAKIGEGDPRDEDGRVTKGKEWVVVWDGLTGDEIARAPWPDRREFPDYNRASRNQIAVAYLDGKTPSLLVLRGTYKRMLVEAYRLDNGRLTPIWKYTNKELDRTYQGQGAHFTLAADVDYDGKDEIVLGSAVLDDDGTPLWTTGKGHPDAAYLTDVDPNRPGLEIAYIIETRQKERGGLCVADAASGKLLWQLEKPTRHVHGKGLCADIDPAVPGMEVYGADSENHKMTGARWMFSAAGDLLLSGDDIKFDFSVTTAYWDGDLQKEIVRRQITNYGGASLLDRVEGRIQIIADMIGDWREELITTLPGELRVYSTTLPAMDRRTCLMQDPIYRAGTTMNAMGYTQEPTTGVCLEAVAPNINLTLIKKEDGQFACRVAVSAPVTSGLTGTVRLSAVDGFELQRDSFPVDLKPGGRVSRTVDLRTERGTVPKGAISATLESGHGTLRAQLPIRLK